MSATIGALLTAGAARLDGAGVPGAARDARLLMAHCLGIGADRVTLVLRDLASAELAQTFDLCLERRMNREPVSHILGLREFYGRSFVITPDVLDPRPETETLVAAALEAPFDRVLDLGTGSGAILLTLLVERPNVTGVGVDLSDHALEVARQNAEKLDVSGRVDLRRSDWWSDVSGEFDLIVSNPPYIAQDEMTELSPEVLREPAMALTDGADGLTAYRTIAAGAIRHLSAGGRLLVEIGWRQGAEVRAIFACAGLSDVQIIADLDGRDRVVFARKPA